MKYKIVSDMGANSSHTPVTAKSGNHLRQVWHLVKVVNGIPKQVGYIKKHFNNVTGTANNPVVIEMKIGNRFACGKASGCGYEKTSAAIEAALLNMSIMLDKNFGGTGLENGLQAVSDVASQLLKEQVYIIGEQ